MIPFDNVALAEGLFAISLVTVGHVENYPQLLNQAVLSYGKALNGLTRILAGNKPIVEDETLAAVSMLAQCEFFDVIRDTEEFGWRFHVIGNQQLIAARGSR